MTTAPGPHSGQDRPGQPVRRECVHLEGAADAVLRGVLEARSRHDARVVHGDVHLSGAGGGGLDGGRVRHVHALGPGVRALRPDLGGDGLSPLQVEVPDDDAVRAAAGGPQGDQSTDAGRAARHEDGGAAQGQGTTAGEGGGGSAEGGTGAVHHASSPTADAGPP